MLLHQQRLIGFLTTGIIITRFIRPGASFSFLALPAAASRPGHQKLAMTATDLSGTSQLSTDPSKLPVTESSKGSSVTIYPYDFDQRSLTGGTVKVLHLIRHAQGFHNVEQDYRALANLDARLTPLGIDQCQQLAQRIQQAAATRTTPLADLAQHVDLIVTSPLTRCVQTTLWSLGQVSRERGAPIVAHDSIRETVNFNCDRRRSISELRAEYPLVDFAHVPTNDDALWQASVDRLGNDVTWTQHRESSQLHSVADRGRAFFAWLATRPERHVAVCSHCAFLRCILHYGHTNEVPGQPPQILDDRPDKVQNRPVVEYRGFSVEEQQAFQSDFTNCELRSVVAHFPKR
jgi:broad specificity phosphatase PhoE